ncbi:hypothetical protein QJS04_geneDACA006044 [Acorus gramineus]|uniref:Myb/SANT-like DNA-binding domain-containing protein n=1 Tax=Acorus gramineus TaxID=55184 RepID=A0AAV9B1W4_ACOGR|nr:hypothetical protein QJS04_geneDACA006044 [Acorus gramineus]
MDDHHRPSAAATTTAVVPSRPTYNGGGGGREDCWSEGASSALIDAWGDRYLELSRGNLRQKDWKDVAGAVNARQDSHGRPRKTDVQCKNRIDTLKKKYKIEKVKLGPSSWPFFSRLDQLVGPSASASAKKPQQAPAKPHAAVTFTLKPNPNPNPYSAGSSSGSSRDHRMEDDEDDDDEDEEDLVGVGEDVRGRGEGGAGVFGELARAIVRFGEIYERVESAKQQQMVEMERQRMEFAKELEYQRMHMFVEAQLELEKMKRPRYSSSAGKK